MPIQAILALITAAVPGVTNLILAIKNASNGQTTLVASISAADAEFDQTIQQAQTWLAAHTTAAAAAPAAKS